MTELERKHLLETTTGKNRIMIYGPKHDGTYVVEFRTAAGEALAISIPARRSTGDPVFSGANAVRIVRAGCSVRNLWRAHGVSLTEPSTNHPKPVHEGSRDPAFGNRAGFSFGH